MKEEFAYAKSNNILNDETKVPKAIDIFNLTEENFVQAALNVFQYQLDNNRLYQQYCTLFNQERKPVNSITDILFLPISFFKTHIVKSFEGQEEIVFTSSGTTGVQVSGHHIKSLALYEASFITCFKKFYGDPAQYAFLCLLPSYLGRQGSSLIYMAEKLVAMSANEDSGFFLDAQGSLFGMLQKREQLRVPTFLLGVTFALLDFAAETKLDLKHTIIMETGGMKGRKQELTRAQVHEELEYSFGVAAVHSEYGMTELLSQAYSAGHGLFRCPPWMRVLVRDEDDPFAVRHTGAGLLCIIDLANIYSCSFIETADLGKVYEDGSFEVLGRMDNSDIRGCSLLAL